MRVVVSLGNAALSNPDVQQVRNDLFTDIRNASLGVHALMDALVDKDKTASRFSAKGGFAAIGAVGEALAVLSGSGGTRTLL